MVELKYSIYKGKNIIFIVSPDKIIVQTSLAEHYLSPEEWYDNEYLPVISFFIEKGKIYDMKTLRAKILGKFYLESTRKRHEVMDI